MVSIMTTMIMIIVISLIVVGFAQITRRNQRATLDRQLSTQAFYAAESGINDARDLIATAVSSGTVVPNKTGCNDTGGGFYTPLVTTIDAASNVGYSCLLVDTSPTELSFSNLGTDSLVLPILPEGGVNLSDMELTLTSNAPGNPASTCPTTLNQTFSSYSSWTCGYGVIRLDLVRANGTFNASDLRDRTMTTFAVPFSSGGVGVIPFQPGAANTNAKVGMSCTAASCKLMINFLAHNAYYLRVSSLYRDVSMTLRARDPSFNYVGLQNVQAAIDATGRAQDVLRRVKVNVPLRASSQNQLPDYAIQSTDSLCKRFAVMDGYFDSQASGVTSTNRLCQP
jgi:hypothetical protein